MKVCREDEEAFEGHRNLAALLKVQVVDLAFHRENPAVQHFGWRDFLPAKVIDEIDAVVSFELERRVVDPAGLIEAEVETFEREFATSSDEGALRPEVSAVVGKIVADCRSQYRKIGSGKIKRLVIQRIENRNDLSLALDRL